MWCANKRLTFYSLHFFETFKIEKATSNLVFALEGIISQNARHTVFPHTRQRWQVSLTTSSVNLLDRVRKQASSIATQTCITCKPLPC